MARKGFDAVDDTYNEVLPPYTNDTLKTIIFAHTRYSIPDGGAESYQSLVNDLNAAVVERSTIKLNAVIERLAPYRVGTVGRPAFKQTEIKSVKEFRKYQPPEE